MCRLNCILLILFAGLSVFFFVKWFRLYRSSKKKDETDTVRESVYDKDEDGNPLYKTEYNRLKA